MKKKFTEAEIAYLEAMKKAEVIQGPLKYNFTEITFHLARLEDQFYRKLLE